MLKTVAIIVISVAIFGILFFVLVKNAMKKRLDYYLNLHKEKKEKRS
jgi:hypothetical protein|tara:strand:- start:435 stop:575 length:141 start_codon:yes stop_codon:yes gene_type:complete